MSCGGLEFRQHGVNNMLCREYIGSIKGTAVWRLILQALMIEIWKLFLN